MRSHRRSGGARRWSLLVAALTLASSCAPRRGPSAPTPAGATRQFTFAWPFREGDGVAPRGGTTQGWPVELDLAPSAAWRRLKEPELRAVERRWQATRAMQGSVRER